MEKIILSAGPTTKPAEAIWYTDQGYYLLGKIGEGLVDKDLINESKKCPCPKARNETRAGCCYTLGGWRINDYRITGKEVPEGILSLTGFTGPTLMIDYSTKLVVTIMHSSLHPKRKDEEETKLKNKYHALITEEIYKNLQ